MGANKKIVKLVDVKYHIKHWYRKYFKASDYQRLFFSEMTDSQKIKLVKWLYEEAEKDYNNISKMLTYNNFEEYFEFSHSYKDLIEVLIEKYD